MFTGLLTLLFQGFWEAVDFFIGRLPTLPMLKDYGQIEENMPEKLESFAFEMHDFLKNEGFVEEANRLLKPLIEKNWPKLPGSGGLHIYAACQPQQL